MILQMEKLCLHYGPLIGYIGSKPYHDMPKPNALAHPSVEPHLRQLGFGYRAKYLYKTAVMVAQQQHEGWLDSLRNPESPIRGCKASDAGDMPPEGRDGYRRAHEALLGLQGVGPKVADCVCLMGLGWGEAVPVDTHGMNRSRRPSNPTKFLSQCGRSLSVTTSLARANTAVSPKRLTMLWVTNFEAFGARKLAGLTASCSQLIYELSPIDLTQESRQQRSSRRTSRRCSQNIASRLNRRLHFRSNAS